MPKKYKDDSRNDSRSNDGQRRENISDEGSSEKFASDLRGDELSELIPAGTGPTGQRTGTLMIPHIFSSFPETFIIFYTA